jgi:fatty-acyl-CoA synthase
VWAALDRYGTRPCVVAENRVLSYDEVRDRVAARALWLQQSSPELAHVGILLRNSQEYIEWILACSVSGRVRVPLNILDPNEVQAYKLEHGEIDVLVTTSELREELGFDEAKTVCVDLSDYEQRFAAFTGRPAIREAPDRYRLSYTGGTTGTPKAVVETDVQELAMMRNALMEVARPRLGSVFVAATPISHASGAFVVPTILGGGALSWTERFDPERLADWSWLGEHAQDVEAFLVPTAMGTLAETVKERSGRKPRIIYGGAPCPPATLEAAIDALDARLVQVYGQAEVPLTIAVLRDEDHRAFAASELAGVAGRAFTYVDVAIERGDGSRADRGETGEIIVRGEHCMHGYWKNEEATREKLRKDGSVITNDLGYFDDSGMLHIVGRSRELIISGGFNVYPQNVETRFGTVPGVRELVVFGVPDDHWGEVVTLGVVTESGAEPSVELVAELDQIARTALANFERPKAIVAVEEIPLTPVGKPDRRELSKQYADKAQAALASK